MRIAPIKPRAALTLLDLMPGDVFSFQSDKYPGTFMAVSAYNSSNIEPNGYVQLIDGQAFPASKASVHPVYKHDDAILTLDA